MNTHTHIPHHPEGDRLLDDERRPVGGRSGKYSTANVEVLFEQQQQSDPMPETGIQEATVRPASGE